MPMQLDVSACFVPLLKWLLDLWKSDRMVLAIDPTMKGDQINSIVISAVYRSCAIPLAAHAGQQTRQVDGVVVDMLEVLSESMPKQMTVLVMCDRGLRSPKLWDQIRSAGWHPMRQSVNTTRLPARPYRVRVTHTCGYGTCIRRRGTMIVVWDRDQDEPWPGHMTDPAPGVCLHASLLDRTAAQDAQGVGWQWQNTRRTDPERVSRHWLTLSVATIWTLAYGTRVEDAIDLGVAPGRLRAPPKSLASNHRSATSRPRRIVSVLRPQTG